MIREASRPSEVACSFLPACRMEASFALPVMHAGFGNRSMEHAWWDLNGKDAAEWLLENRMK